jgi:hypothetical protein
MTEVSSSRQNLLVERITKILGNGEGDKVSATAHLLLVLKFQVLLLVITILSQLNQ